MVGVRRRGDVRVGPRQRDDVVVAELVREVRRPVLRPQRPRATRPRRRAGSTATPICGATATAAASSRSRPPGRVSSSSPATVAALGPVPSSAGADGGPTTGTSTDSGVRGTSSEGSHSRNVRWMPTRAVPSSASTTSPRGPHVSAPVEQVDVGRGDDQLDRDARAGQERCGDRRGGVLPRAAQPRGPRGRPRVQVGAHADAEPADPQRRAGPLDRLVAVVAQRRPHAQVLAGAQHARRHLGDLHGDREVRVRARGRARGRRAGGSADGDGEREGADESQGRTEHPRVASGRSFLADEHDECCLGETPFVRVREHPVQLGHGDPRGVLRLAVGVALDREEPAGRAQQEVVDDLVHAAVVAAEPVVDDAEAAQDLAR